MIGTLRLQGLGVIDAAELDLGAGLTVLTGETGAGKTMVITSLQLLLGAKASAGLIRTGAERAQVTAAFERVDDGVLERVAAAGGVADDDTVTAARVVAASGRSRAALGGAAVPVAVLSEVGSELVAIHGQHEQTRLLSPARQRELLDRFGGHTDLTDAVVDAYAHLRRLTGELDDLTTRRAERLREADALRFGLAEVEQVRPTADEDVLLRAEETRLAHAVDLSQAAGLVAAGLSGDDGSVTEQLALLQRTLDAVREHDQRADDLATRLAELGYLAADLGSDLRAYAGDLEAEPARLGEVQERRAALASLTRKYGPELSDVLDWEARAQVRVDELAGTDDRLDELHREVAQAETVWGAAAVSLREARRAAADRLSSQVTAELASLAMPEAELLVTVDDRAGAPGSGPRVTLPDGAEATASAVGLDDVAFLLRPHRGGPFAPVQRGASGGELSRVMLAIEVVLADADPVPTIVFDEVDAGVGGSAAVEVGRRLPRLGAAPQVLVVSHLPQVAAFADHHWVVRKTTSGQVTASDVVELDDTERVKELTRMLAGLSDSSSGQAHAEELLEVARQSR